MNQKIEYIILKKEQYSEYTERILNFYKPRYKSPFTEITIENSAIIGLAMSDKKIVGAVRAISDLTRHAIIVDLMVDEDFRKQKIGTSLIKLIVKSLVEYKVKNIGLTTDPGVNWLPDFYKKTGFVPLEDCVHLEYKN